MRLSQLSRFMASQATYQMNRSHPRKMIFSNVSLRIPAIVLEHNAQEALNVSVSFSKVHLLERTRKLDSGIFMNVPVSGRGAAFG